MRGLRSELSLADAGLLAGLAAVWGFTFLFIKVAVEGLTPLQIVSMRTLTGLVVLMAVIRIRRIAMPRGSVAWLHLAFLAVPGNVIPWTLVAWAQQTIPSGLTAVLYSLMPIMTLLISVLVSVERFTTHKLAGLLMATVGTVVVVGPGSGSPDHIGAVMTVLAACALLAAGAVYAKRYVTPHVRALPMAAGQIAVGFAASTTAALLVDGIPAREELTVPVVASVLALGAAGTGLAFVLYYMLIDRAGATNATLVTYLIPVIGVAAGWLFLDESLRISLVIGGAVIVAGIWVAQRSPRGAAHTGTGSPP